MKHMVKIASFPSRLRLACALLLEEHGETRPRVEFTLEHDEKVLCTVTNINTSSGKIAVSGHHDGHDEYLPGFYEADLTSKVFIFK